MPGAPTNGVPAPGVSRSVPATPASRAVRHPPPETSGAGDENLPAFTPAEETYTLYADCTGKGSVSLVDRDDPDGKPHPISCDDVPTVGVVHTEAVPQRLMAKVTGGAAQWAIVIVPGAMRAV
ncbi:MULTISPECIES: hypothetical protein [Streptomyces]|uniref:hypothetical protein n=1 Tax=Streptomyces TaxID=1883 RepID=UPI000D50AB19|nr:MULTISPECIES: hypothetical protein [Streptomyces]PVC71449.1 hypothetical protein DBP15_12300 [Streptomyces sp. CS065A]